MRTAAVLPVKSFSRAKQRLGASVEDHLRLELARAMVADVLAALERTEAIERTIVVTREREAALAAHGLDAIVLDDVAESGQSEAAALGVAYAATEGFERVLCVPGDCPALDPEELHALLTADQARDAHAPTVVIVPDRHGTGTNGLLLSPPEVIAPSFGAGSCERHRQLALARGVTARIERPQSLLLDIDTGADLAELRIRLAALDAPAPRTRAVLDGQPQHAGVLPITTRA
jgi:2-phospho-L-lactate/phosphoenolpyruvate guanylyltransferase